MNEFSKIIAETEVRFPAAGIPSGTLREQNERERGMHELTPYREAKIQSALGANWLDTWYWKVALDAIENSVENFEGCKECGAETGHKPWCRQR